MEKKLDGNCTRMLHALLNKTVAVQPLTPHLTNHPSKMSQTYWALPKKLGQTPKQCFMDSDTWTHQCQLTSKKLYLSALCEYWMSSRGLTKSNGGSGWMVKKVKYSLMMIIIINLTFGIELKTCHLDDIPVVFILGITNSLPIIPQSVIALLFCVCVCVCVYVSFLFCFFLPWIKKRSFSEVCEQANCGKQL